MDKSENLLTFFLQQSDKIIDQTITHIGLTSISIIIACFIGLPLGISILRNKRLASMVLGVVGIFQTIPSIALLGFLIPLLGIGPIPAVTALFLYALLPIVRNTYTGIIGIDTSIIEAAQALGMTDRQILFQVQLPLALPVIMAGIRTAAIINVGVATLAAYIAAGGLGEFIFGGIALNNTNMILAGALPAAGLAILFDYGLSKIQKINIAKLKTGALILGMGLLILSSFYVIKLHDNKLLAGFTPEFMGRQDGYLGLKEKYGFKIPTVVISDAVMYKAAFEQDLDLISGYSTDGRLKAYDLITLQDDQEIFPPYYAAPLIRNDILEKYPELQPAIEMLTGKINDSIMTELNYQVDYRKVTPAQVAKEFLESNGMNFSAKQNNSGTVRLGSKIFGEQYILANIYKILIEGQTNLKVETKTGLCGTKICFDALLNNEIDMYPEYPGTGFLVILNPDKETINKLLKNKSAVYSYVKSEFDKKYDLTWLKPIGFNNAYALMMRREQAAQLKIKKISDLTQLANDK